MAAPSGRWSGVRTLGSDHATAEIKQPFQFPLLPSWAANDNKFLPANIESSPLSSVVVVVVVVVVYLTLGPSFHFSTLTLLGGGPMRAVYYLANRTRAPPMDHQLRLRGRRTRSTKI